MSSQATGAAPRRTWIIATRNPHKVEEIRGILGASFEYKTLEDFPDAPSIVEDAPNFAGNASKKALAFAKWLGARADAGFSLSPSAGEGQREGAWVLADDSGLEVDPLGGAPGVHSARFASLSPTGG